MLQNLALSNSFTIHLALFVDLVTDNLPEKSDGVPMMASRQMIFISIDCIIRIKLRPESVPHGRIAGGRPQTRSGNWKWNHLISLSDQFLLVLQLKVEVKYMKMKMDAFDFSFESILH